MQKSSTSYLYYYLTCFDTDENSILTSIFSVCLKFKKLKLRLRAVVYISGSQPLCVDNSRYQPNFSCDLFEKVIIFSRWATPPRFRILIFFNNYQDLNCYSSFIYVYYTIIFMTSHNINYISLFYYIILMF